MNRAPLSSPSRVLFCGAFQVPRNGSTGGVLYACRALLDTPEARRMDWILVDSAQPLPPPARIVRFFNAGVRLAKALGSLFVRRVDATLIFTPFLTMSLLEKLLIAWWSGWLGKPTALAFRSEIHPDLVRQRLIWPLLRSTLRRVQVVVCQSQEAKAALDQYFPQYSSKYVVIPNWIATEDLPAPHGTAPLSEPRSWCQLTYIGWLEPIKDVTTILRALAEVNRTTRDWRLAICGNGSQQAELEARVQEWGLAGQVEFPGWINRAQKRLRLAQTDVFVMASRSEGLPNSLVEAMAYGIPVVATRVGGIPTLVGPENGFLFDVGDYAGLSRALCELIGRRDLRQRIGVANSQKIVAQHGSSTAFRALFSHLFPDGSWSKT